MCTVRPRNSILFLLFLCTALLPAFPPCRVAAQEYVPALLRGDRLFFVHDDQEGIIITVLDAATGERVNRLSGLSAYPGEFISFGGAVAVTEEKERLVTIAVLNGTTGEVLLEMSAEMPAGTQYRAASTADHLFTFVTAYTEKDVPENQKRIVKEMHAWSPEGKELAMTPLPEDREIPFAAVLEHLGAEPVPGRGGGEAPLPAEWTVENDEFRAAAVAPGRVEGGRKDGGGTRWTYEYAAADETGGIGKFSQTGNASTSQLLLIVLAAFFFQTAQMHATVFISFVVSLLTKNLPYARRLRIGIVLAVLYAALFLVFPPADAGAVKTVWLALGIGAVNAPIPVAKEIGWKGMLGVAVCYFFLCCFSVIELTAGD